MKRSPSDPCPSRTRFVALLLAGPFSAVACSLSAPSVKDYAQTRSMAGAPNGGNQAGDASTEPAPDAGGGSNAGAGAGSNASGGSSGKMGTAGAPSVCVPELEICNGLDDDCDGAVDNGCPSELLRGSAVQGMVVGDSSGGSSFTDLCTNDEMIVGFQLAMSAYLEQLTAICQKYTLQVSTGVVPYVYSVGLGASRPLGPHPKSTTTALTQATCPAGSFVVGLHAYEQSGLVSNNASPELTGISVLCAVPVVDLMPSVPELDWTDTVEVGPFYGTGFDSTKATFRSSLLAKDRFAVGAHGASGLWVDNVGPTSSNIRVLLK